MMSSSSSQKGEAVEGAREMKRRRRSVEEKREIAEASLQPGTSVAEVAQAYGVHPSQVGKWRRLHRSGLLGNASAPPLLAVRVVDAVEPDETSHASKQKVKQNGSIHIEFARVRVSIESGADAATVRAVLESLAG
jgi:transposase-like protein